LCVMYFFHICTILRWEDFLHRSVLIYIYIWNVEKLVTFYLFHYKKMLKDIFLEVNFLSFCRKWWKYRDEEMKHSDLQTLEDTLTFFGQSFLFTMKLIFCRISFGQMRRQIIDLVVGKRYTGNGSSWKLLNRLWKYLRIDYALVLCGDDATNKK
ncbi:hypothetical protein T01_11965, partial [Trichinella spiralis]